MASRLMTAAQVTETFGLPSQSTLKTMRLRGLKHVPLGKAILYDEADVAAFIEASKVQLCPDQTAAPGSNGSRSEGPGTSSGTRSAAKSSSLPALQTAERLTRLSKRSSETGESPPGRRGHVIPATFQ